MKRIVSLLLRLVVAGILLQTLYFKFSGAPESIALFTKLGIEPWGRIGTGVFELIAALLVLWPSTIFFGASLSVGLMAGAVASHLTIIGIESNGDGGLLFSLAVVVFVFSAILCFMYRNQGLNFIKKIR